eukprot:scaffold97115_cov66-Phaeocystis_antarctica.AAC.1
MAPSSPSSSDNERVGASWAAPDPRAPPGAAALPPSACVGDVSRDSDRDSRSCCVVRSAAIEKPFRICCGVLPRSRWAKWSASCSSRWSHSRKRAARWSAKNAADASVVKSMLVSGAPAG